MDTKNLPIGTKLHNEYGNWVITNVTHFDGSTWYDVRGEKRMERRIPASQIVKTSSEVSVSRFSVFGLGERRGRSARTTN